MKLRGYLHGLAVLGVALALAGCGGISAGGINAGGAAPAAAQSPAAAYPVGTPSPQELPTVYPYPVASDAAPSAEGKSVDPAMIELAKQDLAQRLSVAVDQITVVSSEYTDWPDSSLGCPQPGMAYSQVITPGYRIVLEQGQKQYDYHTGLKSMLVLCTP